MRTATNNGKGKGGKGGIICRRILPYEKYMWKLVLIICEFFLARSGQSFGEDYASPSESNQLDHYSANRQHVEHSSRKNYNGSSCSGVENGFHHEESSSVGNERMDQEPGPIGDDGEERQDNIRNGTDSLEAARAAWTPPTFRTCREFF